MANRPTLTYHGLSSFSIEYDQTTIVVDPWIDDPEWTKTSVSDIVASGVDYVLVTHGARDHLGDAFPIADQTDAHVLTEPAVAEHLSARGVPDEQIRRMIWGNAFVEGGIEFRALETRHLSYFESAAGHRSGLPLGFHLGFGDTSLYYVGDTSIFGDLELFTSLNQPDLILLPVGSAPGDLAPLPPRDAAVVASWLDVETVIPVHYVPGSDEPALFREHLGDLAEPENQPEIVTLGVDERYHL